MTIRAKLFAAIALTVLGPVVTIGVALARVRDARRPLRGGPATRARAQALALELKFAVTDMNGWQTAYGYDDGRSRPTFETAAEQTEDAARAARGAS